MYIMKNYLLTCLLITFTLLLSAQNKAVELIESSVDGKVMVSAKNNTDTDYKIIVQLKLVNAQSSLASPIEKIIQAGSEELVFEISPEDPSLNWTYSIGFSYEKYYDQINAIIDFESINVFTMNGCGRCQYTVNFLNENKIAFTEYNTSENDANNMAMWETLKAANYDGYSITMPVIVMDGKTYYNINNLSAELENMFLK